MVIGIILAALLLFGSLWYFGHKDYKSNDVKIIDYAPVESVLTIFEQELFRLVNEYRVSENLNVLKTDELARSLAYDHCRYMIEQGRISHDNYAIRTSALFMNGAQSVGENVGYGYSTASGFCSGYITSTHGHREVLEGKSYTHIGVRCVKNPKGRYYNVLLLVNYGIKENN